MQAILDRADIEQQAYRSCFGIFSLLDKYGSLPLERSRSTLLTHTSSPTYQQLKNILGKGKDVPDLPEKKGTEKTTRKRGFQRGAEYFGGDGHA